MISRELNCRSPDDVLNMTPNCAATAELENPYVTTRDVKVIKWILEMTIVATVRYAIAWNFGPYNQPS